MAKQPTTRELVEEGFRTLDERLRTMMDALREVIQSIGKEELANQIPWINESNHTEQAASTDPIELAQLYSIAFQLLNMVEERVAITTRRRRERVFGTDAEKGLWPERLRMLKASGISEDNIAAALSSVRVEPVFTAHPTEAKRASVRERHRAIYRLLLKQENDHYTDMEREMIRQKMHSALEALWFTGEIHIERPTVKRELHNTLYYLEQLFPEVIARVDLHLAESWKEAGFQESTLESAGGGAQIRFGLWIGGDRDGHPFVTAQVTRETLAELRSRALRLHREGLLATAGLLTASVSACNIPAQLKTRLESIAADLGAHGADLLDRHIEEPWRAFCHLLAAQLDTEGTTRSSFRKDLDLMEESLSQIGATRSAMQYVRPMRRKLDVFGFHLAVLDIRQNSAFHEQAAEQLFAAAKIEDGGSYSSWPEDRRLRFLTEELESARPLLHADHQVGAEADTVRDCYRVLAEQQTAYGCGIGALIVSMTRQVSDLLLVHLFARETGLVTYDDRNVPVCPLPVVPLFETRDDLDRAPHIIEAYVRHPVAQRSLALQQTPGERPIQQVMLGYSDSNKDAGILASQIALHRAQNDVLEVGQRLGIKIRFFHGRGGTVSRGAGPVDWFVKALPTGALGSGLRMTEQGETIAAKYANLASATYNLELLQACVTQTSACQKNAAHAIDPGFALIEPLGHTSQDAYRSFVEREGFFDFFRQATPIDALEQMRIGSRPSRRTGTSSLNDLRAIPWVFSWTQSRFYLPGWFGVGSALKSLRKTDPSAYDRLPASIAESPFARYVFTNVESNLLSADLNLMKHYSTLVNVPSVADAFMKAIEEEYIGAQKEVGRLFPNPVSERRPRFEKTLTLRQNPLRSLHLQQIEQLRDWRAKGGDIPEALMITINAISSGLRTTG